MSWHQLKSAKIALTRDKPISKYNTVALNLTTSTHDTGIANTGYWGLPLNGGWIYRFSVYLQGSGDAKVKCFCVCPLEAESPVQKLPTSSLCQLLNQIRCSAWRPADGSDLPGQTSLRVPDQLQHLTGESCPKVSGLQGGVCRREL